MSERVRNGIPRDDIEFLPPTGWYLPGIVDPEDMVIFEEAPEVRRSKNKAFLEQMRVDFAQLDSQAAGHNPQGSTANEQT